MTTASALEDITDRAGFELLATSVLRAAEPKYAAIIHTGSNSKGETIVSPIDGIHVVPGSDPPHWVAVQHTTCDEDHLRGKWLSEFDSDLAKATRELDALRSRDPSIRATVVLTTNQRPKKELVLDVHRYAAEHGFTLDIWEQSRLASFLDDTPTGHWLRKQHLGLRTELLSAPLLHALGLKSLEAYRSEARCPGTGLVARAAHGTVQEALRDDSKTLVFLVGRSGFGKSVMAAQVLETWLTSGRLGLWLPATLITTSVETALNRWLHDLCPDIDANAAPIAFELGATKGGLLVCVDDVNRCADPGRVLRLIYLEAKRASAAESGKGRRVTFIVPIWPGADAALPPDVHREAWM